MKVAVEDFFSQCDQRRSFLRIWSHFLKKSLMENFNFRTVQRAQAAVMGVNEISYNFCWAKIKDCYLQYYCSSAFYFKFLYQKTEVYLENCQIYDGGFTAQKISFQLRTSSINMTKYAGNCGFCHIYWRNPQLKTFCAGSIISDSALNISQRNTIEVALHKISAGLKQIAKKIKLVQWKGYTFYKCGKNLKVMVFMAINSA